MQKPNTTETMTEMLTETTDAAKVPFFARMQGRPNLTVRSGVRAGASEETVKRR